MSNIPPPRRIVTSNLPLPNSLSDVQNAEPAVQVATEDLTATPELGGQAARRTVFTHEKVPTSNVGLDIKPNEDILKGGIAIPGGVNVRYNELAPGGRVPMHRSQTTDYAIFLNGEVVLITPDEAYDPATGKGKLQETVCRPGDCVMQRGTLHAWENRGSEWVRFFTVIIGSEQNTISQGRNTAHQLPDCFDV